MIQYNRLNFVIPSLANSFLHLCDVYWQSQFFLSSNLLVLRGKNVIYVRKTALGVYVLTEEYHVACLIMQMNILVFICVSMEFLVCSTVYTTWKNVMMNVVFRKRYWECSHVNQNNIGGWNTIFSFFPISFAISYRLLKLWLEWIATSVQLLL